MNFKYERLTGVLYGQVIDLDEWFVLRIFNGDYTHLRSFDLYTRDFTTVEAVAKFTKIY